MRARWGKWGGITATLLAVALLAVGVLAVRRHYLDDPFFRSEVNLRLYILSTLRSERRLLLVGDSNVGVMSCVSDFAKWDVLNLGIFGLRSGRMLDYVRSHVQAWPRFDAAILWVGINDLRFDNVNGTEVARNVLAILSGLSVASSRLALVRQVPLPEGRDTGYSTRVNQEVAAMNAILTEEVRPELATIIVPFPDESAGRWEDFASDGLHLSARGYSHVCAEVGRWLSYNE